MDNQEIARIKQKTSAYMVKCFYHDFMPMLDQIKTDVAALHVGKQDKTLLNNINRQLKDAESLLRQLMTISVKRPIDDAICGIKDTLVIGSLISTFPYTMRGPIAIISDNGQYIRCPAWGMDKVILKFDKDYVYVRSNSAGKVDLYDKEGVKVKEVGEDEIKW